ncbi:TPA: hypothetical protein ACGA33_000880 [Clostridium perfringens]
MYDITEFEFGPNDSLYEKVQKNNGKFDEVWLSRFKELNLYWNDKEDIRVFNKYAVLPLFLCILNFILVLLYFYFENNSIISLIINLVISICFFYIALKKDRKHSLNTYNFEFSFNFNGCYYAVTYGDRKSIDNVKKQINLLDLNCIKILNKYVEGELNSIINQDLTSLVSIISIIITIITTIISTYINYIFSNNICIYLFIFEAILYFFILKYIERRHKNICIEFLGKVRTEISIRLL